MPDTEQYDSITPYEVPEQPSQYTRLQGQRRKQVFTLDIDQYMMHQFGN